MNRIIISDDLVAQLETATTPVSICDPVGRVMGTFHPILDLEQSLSPLTPEERERRRQESGKPLADFYKDMGIRQ